MPFIVVTAVVIIIGSVSVCIKTLSVAVTGNEAVGAVGVIDADDPLVVLKAGIGRNRKQNQRVAEFDLRQIG